MPLFVVLQPGVLLDDGLKARIANQIRKHGSARHVPSDIFQVDEIPPTLTGKKNGASGPKTVTLQLP